MTKKRTIFLISPVRKQDLETEKKVRAYVMKLRAEGHDVFWPYEDNPFQHTDDMGGFKICTKNTLEILQREEIHIWYDEESGGSKFDMGVTFVLQMLGWDKRIYIVNHDDVPDTVKEKKKSHYKVFRYIESNQ